MDANGRTRAELAVYNGGPMLFLSDTKTLRVGLGVPQAGSSLALFDENGESRLELVVSKDGPMLSMLDANDKTRAGLAVYKDGPRLAMGDEKGKVIWSAPR